MKETDKSNQNSNSDQLSDDENIILNAMGLNGSSRRKFLKQVSVAGIGMYAASIFTNELFARIHEP